MAKTLIVFSICCGDGFDNVEKARSCKVPRITENEVHHKAASYILKKKNYFIFIYQLLHQKYDSR